jgi:hypothetical protein
VRARLAIAAIVFGAVASGTLGAAPRGAGLSALARLEPGLWQLRKTDGGESEIPSICLGDPGALLQLQHRSSPCSRLVIDNGPRAATVRYTCPANGFGRTSVRVETPRLAKIDTQGIIDNAPFAFRAEARRVGACPSR